jgi:hypothetical protein
VAPAPPTSTPLGAEINERRSVTPGTSQRQLMVRAGLLKLPRAATLSAAAQYSKMATSQKAGLFVLGEQGKPFRSPWLFRHEYWRQEMSESRSQSRKEQSRRPVEPAKQRRGTEDLQKDIGRGRRKTLTSNLKHTSSRDCSRHCRTSICNTTDAVQLSVSPRVQRSPSG